MEIREAMTMPHEILYQEKTTEFQTSERQERFPSFQLCPGLWILRKQFNGN
jgi:hypothetical protein